MKIFLTGSSNKPSGGTKVMNQIACLFRIHGFDAYVVVVDDSGPASFLDESAPWIRFQEFESTVSSEDITIDFWPDRRLFEIAKLKKAHQRIFWYHGASLPKGEGVVDEKVFLPNHPYTQHWNVSGACASYIEKTYGVRGIKIIHPFFDSALMESMQQRTSIQRRGSLILARRGIRHIPAIRQKLGDELTVLGGVFHEKKLFDELRRHKFLISVDDGIREVLWVNKIKRAMKYIVSPTFRRQRRIQHEWIVPEGNILGFPMPPTEAAWLGCGVIGFAMGGGLEWMSKENCFLAEDGSQRSLLEQIDVAHQASEADVQQKVDRAWNSVSKFTKEHTWNQITSALGMDI